MSVKTDVIHQLALSLAARTEPSIRDIDLVLGKDCYQATHGRDCEAYAREHVRSGQSELAAAEARWDRVACFGAQWKAGRL